MFTSKELYMMNGGNKLYIYKDGFGDVYSATPEEEAQWAREVVAKGLKDLDQEQNSVSLSCAIDNLRFHHYPSLKALLESKLEGATASRQQAIAAALKDISKHE